MDFTIIDSIPWKELQNAYGSAESTAMSLHALVSGNEDEVEEAIYGFLHSEACHQYTTYSCTPYVVKCVIFILEHKEFGESELSEILGFIGACTNSAKEDDFLRYEILAGRNCYIRYLRNAGRSGKVANKLLEFCNLH